MAMDVPAGRRPELQELEQLSPFELKSKLIELATACGAEAMLNAGRGNPNWVATTPRDAFFLLGQFAMTESRRVWDEPGLGGMPERDGIAARLTSYLDARLDEPGTDLLRHVVTYGTERKGFDPDAWVHELTDAIVGDNYPVPDRMLTHVEQVVHDYLVHELCRDELPDGRFDLFAVEGGTAAVCYIFDSLVANCLLLPGDRIALGVPVFTPYIEIPELERYGFDIIRLEASELGEDGDHDWQYPDREIAKLADPSVRAFFTVNPSNPPSVMMHPETIERIVGVVESSNPNLLLITDDVYGPFVTGFRSLMSAAPRNTIVVYSFSKYFGCTGWRLGVVAIHEDNVFDHLLDAMPADTKAKLARRYGTISVDPDSLKLIDRMVADSRQVALNHTAGLSLPQQVQMGLFAIASLIDTDDHYRTRIREILQRRLQLLWEGIGLPMRPNTLRAGYYEQIDLELWAEVFYGQELRDYFVENYEVIDGVIRLAERDAIVLLCGLGFEGPQRTIRISLANLPDEAYAKIGAAIMRMCLGYLDEFYAQRRGGAKRDIPTR